jgi:predicted dehydrogenase
MKRRDFLKTGSMAGLGAGLTILNFPVFGKKAPSNQIVLGVMGVNSRGKWLAQVASNLPGATIGYICDVDPKATKMGLDAVKNQAKAPQEIEDVRELVTKKDLDGLIIASPDHWHAPAAIMACVAGKAVYVEKPLSHNPQEGEWLVAAAKKYKTVAQMGNQRRSWPNMQQAVRDLQVEKVIGDLKYGHAWYSLDRKPIGVGKEVPIPAGFNWDLWQGPAPRESYKDNIVHYDWHWRWKWGTGESCNNATHELDCIRWMMGLDIPTQVQSAGGRYSYSGDDWECPDTQQLFFQFPGNKAASWQGRSAFPIQIEHSQRGFAIMGEHGSLVSGGDDGYKILDMKNKLVKEVKPNAKEQANTGNVVSPAGEFYDAIHIQNWLEAIKGDAAVNSPLEEGHKSVLLCHLGNIAHRTQATLQIESKTGHILRNSDAQKLWQRTYQPGWKPQF